MLHPDDKNAVLSLYEDARRMVERANADAAKTGLVHARRALRDATKLMRCYGLLDDA